MRFLYAITALGIGSLVLLSPTPEAVRGCDGPFYGGPVVYYQPMPAYYCPPPAFYPPPPYLRPAVAEVGAYDKVGFKPKTIRVAPGTTVRWVNRGQERHTVTSRDGLFDSGPLAPGATFRVTFLSPGTYRYFCRPHEKMGMVGTVVVGYGPSGGSAAGSGGSGY